MTVLSATLTTIGIGALSYCIYFDYRRKTDSKFRNSLKDEQRLVQKLRTESEPLHSKEKILESARNVLIKFQSVSLPEGPQQKEQFFMEVLAKGEQLVTSSKVEELEQACVCFYAGLKVYPVPQELIQLYQKSLPERVFQLLVHVIALDSPQQHQNQREQHLDNDGPILEEIIDEDVEDE
eukprot:NODE_926_length_3035_cov_0.169959.p2 type:complete len:180 gc:universal NODE_926_length_3035_cov_0.169959:2059-2598(+)